MPVFFFNLRDGSEGTADPEGVNLPDLQAAKNYAMEVARELMNRNEVERRHWQLNVFDSDGSLVAEVPFAKIDATLDHLSRPLRQTIEQLAERRRDLAETISGLERLRLQLRAIRARSQRRPYLITQNGRQLGFPSPVSESVAGGGKSLSVKKS
jgi:hypothetical protein